MSLALETPKRRQLELSLKPWLMLGIGLQIICVLSLELLALRQLSRFNDSHLATAFILSTLVLLALSLGVYMNRGPKLKNFSLRTFLGSSLPLCAVFIIFALNSSVLALFFELLRPYALAPWLQAALYALCFTSFPAYLLGQSLDASYQRLVKVGPAHVISIFSVLGTAFFLAVLLTTNPANGLWSILGVLSLLVFATAKKLGPQLLMLGVLLSAVMLNAL